MLRQLADTYLPRDLYRDAREAEFDIARWRRRYRAVIHTLQAQGISVASDLRAGEEHSVQSRCEWHPFVMAFARSMEYPLAKIDPPS